MFYVPPSVNICSEFRYSPGYYYYVTLGQHLRAPVTGDICRQNPN